MEHPGACKINDRHRNKISWCRAGTPLGTRHFPDHAGPFPRRWITLVDAVRLGVADQDTADRKHGLASDADAGTDNGPRPDPGALFNSDRLHDQAE